MKAFATIGLGSLGTISFQQAIHASRADRPHGVSADCWLPLDENFGVVLSRKPCGGGITGHFMVKQNGIWHRFIDEVTGTGAPASAEANTPRG
ncbi:MAG: hypothetical protein IRZ28_12600 [Steroidobacteraceae bacterium]|nr:hypothetical protein [Steroidobacteraceae bacterium]